MTRPINELLIEALSLSGFENWRPPVDVPELNRPAARPRELPGAGRIAAVLILIYPGSTKDDSIDNEFADAKLVLTKRNAGLSTHASQISFPGGKKDKSETLQQTALRETSEEIGIAASEVKVLGRLNSIYIPPSDFTVTPFVGCHPGQPDFIRREDEVEEVIEVSVDQLLKPSTLVFGEISQAGGEKIRVPYYQIGSHQVWGATAIILGELIERLRRVA